LLFFGLNLFSDPLVAVGYFVPGNQKSFDAFAVFWTVFDNGKGKISQHGETDGAGDGGGGHGEYMRGAEGIGEEGALLHSEFVLFVNYKKTYFVFELFFLVNGGMGADKDGVERYFFEVDFR